MYGDRMSTTLVNRQLKHVYGDANFVSGVVIAPQAAQSELLCGYGSDGGSMNKLCEPPGRSSKCLPGCGAPAGPRHGDWLSEPGWCNNLSVYDCAWSPDDLRYMLTLQSGAAWTYNELVVGTQSWLRDPVAQIEAFFFSRNANEQKQRALDAYSSFVDAHGEDSRARKVPVLGFDLEAAGGPFFPM